MVLGVYPRIASSVPCRGTVGSLHYFVWNCEDCMQWSPTDRLEECLKDLCDKRGPIFYIWLTHLLFYYRYCYYADLKTFFSYLNWWYVVWFLYFKHFNFEAVCGINVLLNFDLESPPPVYHLTRTPKQRHWPSWKNIFSTGCHADRLLIVIHSTVLTLWSRSSSK
jgi:hypothetical protein